MIHIGSVARHRARARRIEIAHEQPEYSELLGYPYALLEEQASDGNGEMMAESWDVVVNERAVL